MFIQTELTPNPATLKFLPGQTVLQNGTAEFSSVETAENSPLAKRIFKVDGVISVFFGTDFITVTKSENVDWEHLKTEILASIMDHYQSGDIVSQENEGVIVVGIDNGGADRTDEYCPWANS